VPIIFIQPSPIVDPLQAITKEPEEESCLPDKQHSLPIAPAPIFGPKLERIYCCDRPPHLSKIPKANSKHLEII